MNLHVTSHASDWVILRCANAKTLELARSLNEAGFTTWAPVTREIARQDEQRTRQEIAVPLMAGFVFADASRLPELLALSHSPALQFRIWDHDLRRMVAKGHPHFRVFQNGNHRPIPDHELEPLRRLERKPRPARIERTFQVGDIVRTDEAGFTGLNGKVIAVRDRSVVVSFGSKWLEPEMPSWTLRPLDESTPVHVIGVQSERDAA